MDIGADSDPVRYSLDELAAASGVTRRTIRYYQGEHLLDPPMRAGRDAVYGEGHVERLHQIGELRDRGLTLHTIRELLASDSPPRAVSEWLGIDATLSAPWSDDRPQAISREDLVELVGRHGPIPRGLIGDLVEHGYVSRQTDGTWLVPSPALLDHAVQLHHAGITVVISARMRDLMRRRMAKAVNETVQLLVERTGTGFAGDGSAEEIATAVAALRPVTRETAGVILTHEVERALADLLRAGASRGRRRHR